MVQHEYSFDATMDTALVSMMQPYQYYGWSLSGYGLGCTVSPSIYFAGCPTLFDFLKCFDVALNPTQTTPTHPVWSHLPTLFGCASGGNNGVLRTIDTTIHGHICMCCSIEYP